jgi:hypothetical protein
MLTLNVTNRIIMKITVWLIPTRQRFDNCLLKKFNYVYVSGSGVHSFLKVGVEESFVNAPLVSLYIKNTNNAKSEVRFKQLIRDL